MNAADTFMAICLTFAVAALAVTIVALPILILFGGL